MLPAGRFLANFEQIGQPEALRPDEFRLVTKSNTLVFSHLGEAAQFGTLIAQALRHDYN